MNLLNINPANLIVEFACSWASGSFSGLEALLSQSRQERKLIEWILQSVSGNPVVGYLCLVVVMSIVTFLVYGWDKRQAQVDGWRVPEKRLYALSFLGGWPGAIMGQNYFRHKTQKMEFKFLNWAAAALHAVLIVWYLYSLLG